jgi:hypothetical protein
MLRKLQNNMEYKKHKPYSNKNYIITLVYS